MIVTGMAAPPPLVVGTEGVWGTILLVGICWPFVMLVIPGQDNGHVEDLGNVLYMMADAPILYWFAAMFMIAAFFLDWSGLELTQQTSAVQRSLFESIRVSIVWLVDLVIHYWIAPNTVYGEAWGSFSLLRVAGFVILIFSTQMYNGTVKFPKLFNYELNTE